MPFHVNVAPGPGRVGVHEGGNGGHRSEVMSGVFELGYMSISMYKLMIECNCPQEYHPWTVDEVDNKCN